MNDLHVRRLTGYLSHFGKPKFLHPKFENLREIDFAGIELVARESIAKGLLAEINAQLSRSESPCSLRETEWGKVKDEVYRYVVEIIPYREVPQENWLKATEQVLQKLPHIIRNYMQKNPARRR